jgi:hypothetical protein
MKKNLIFINMKTFLELENIIRTWNMKEIHFKLSVMQMKISTSFLMSLSKKLAYQCSQPPSYIFGVVHCFMLEYCGDH